MTYEQAEKCAWDYTASMAQKYDEGLEKGVEIGIEKGAEKGRRVEKTEIARAMLVQGIRIETIASLTGLPPEEIESDAFQVAGQPALPPPSTSI